MGRSHSAGRTARATLATATPYRPRADCAMCGCILRPLGGDGGSTPHPRVLSDRTTSPSPAPAPVLRDLADFSRDPGPRTPRAPRKRSPDGATRRRADQETGGTASGEEDQDREERSSRRRSGGGPLKPKFHLPGIKAVLLPRPADTASSDTAVPARAVFGPLPETAGAGKRRSLGDVLKHVNLFPN